MPPLDLNVCDVGIGLDLLTWVRKEGEQLTPCQEGSQLLARRTRWPGHMRHQQPQSF